MTEHNWEPWSRRNNSWLALAGVAAATALFATVWNRKFHSRKEVSSADLGQLVPLNQAKEEAEWTREAVSYKGGAKGG